MKIILSSSVPKYTLRRWYTLRRRSVNFTSNYVYSYYDSKTVGDIHKSLVFKTRVYSFCHVQQSLNSEVFAGILLTGTLGR